jgi:hypothetical protein
MSYFKSMMKVLCIQNAIKLLPVFYANQLSLSLSLDQKIYLCS